MANYVVKGPKSLLKAFAEEYKVRVKPKHGIEERVGDALLIDERQACYVVYSAECPLTYRLFELPADWDEAIAQLDVLKTPRYIIDLREDEVYGVVGLNSDNTYECYSVLGYEKSVPVTEAKPIERNSFIRCGFDMLRRLGLRWGGSIHTGEPRTGYQRLEQVHLAFFSEDEPKQLHKLSANARDEVHRVGFAFVLYYKGGIYAVHRLRIGNMSFFATQNWERTGTIELNETHLLISSTKSTNLLNLCFPLELMRAMIDHGLRDFTTAYGTVKIEDVKTLFESKNIPLLPFSTT